MRSLSLFLLATLAVYGQTQQYDLLIRGARVIDGTGNPWYLADLGVRGDRIVAIGKLAAASGKTNVDARGLVVAPGFIDIHTHARRAIATLPSAENYVRQGVTTLIEGNDGGSPLPIGEYLSKLPPLGVNFGLFVGHGTVRQAVTGLENRRATPAEIEKMKALVEHAMREGALGLSTGLFYVPGNYAPTEEVVELAKVAARHGGMHISHMRDEAAGVADSVKETIRIGEEAGLPTQVTHHKIIGAAFWGRSEETLRLVEEARSRGVDVTIDQYPYTASSTGTAALFPQWSLAGGSKELIKRLDDAATRKRIKAAIAENIRTNRGGGNPKNVVMASCAHDASLAGKNLAQITDERGLTPDFENAAEVTIEIQRKGGCSAIYHAIDESDLERILRNPFTMVASDGHIPVFGEGVPHPRSYGAFARVLGRYVRERKTISLEDAIRRMSSLPAARLRLYDRGILRAGMKADLAIFDPAAVADKATFSQPHQYAVGVRDVLVNGKFVLRDGKMMGEKPGALLRGAATSLLP